MMKMKAGINGVENKNAIISETQHWFFEKINKIDKPSVRLAKKKGERCKVSISGIEYSYKCCRHEKDNKSTMNKSAHINLTT